MDISERLFETAIKDLNSVGVLYESNHYNLALFQLQQSVEKLVKSFGLKTNIIRPDDIAKKINHLPHKVFTRLYQDQIQEISKYKNTTSLIPDMVPPHQRGKSKIKENLESLEKLHTKVNNTDLSKIKNISTDEINLFIEGAKELEKEPIFDEQKIFDEIKDDFVKTHEHFKTYFNGDLNIAKISDAFISNSDEITRVKVIEHKNNVIRQNNFKYISYIWINLSLITSPHEQSTRYPSISTTDKPSDVYDINNLLIKNIPEFVELLNKTIIKYKEIYKN